MDDAVALAFYNPGPGERLRRAVKPHACHQCPAVIAPGSSYVECRRGQDRTRYHVACLFDALTLAAHWSPEARARLVAAGLPAPARERWSRAANRQPRAIL